MDQEPKQVWETFKKNFEAMPKSKLVEYIYFLSLYMTHYDLDDHFLKFVDELKSHKNSAEKKELTSR